MKVFLDIVKKSLNKIAFTAILLVTSLLVHAQQIYVYKTYDDYLNKKSEIYDDLDYSKKAMTFINGEDKVKYKLDEFWGFTYNRRLFRSNDSKLYWVNSYGNVVLYTAGELLMRLKKHDVRYVNPGDVIHWAISDGLEHDIFDVSFNPANSNGPYNSSYHAFQQAYPQHQKLFDCMGKSKDLFKFQKCLGEYNQLENIQFENSYIENGKININLKTGEGLKPETAAFKFTNNSKSPVVVEKIETNTDIVSATFSPAEVLPGAQGIINVKIDMESYMSDKKFQHSTDNQYTINVRFKGVSGIKTLILTDELNLK